MCIAGFNPYVSFASRQLSPPLLPNPSLLGILIHLTQFEQLLFAAFLRRRWLPLLSASTPSPYCRNAATKPSPETLGDLLQGIAGILFEQGFCRTKSTKDEMALPWKLSGLQKQVLALYREFLRAAQLKDPEERRSIGSIVSAEFRHNAKVVDRKNFQYIEYLLQRGKRQLEQLKSSTTISLSKISLKSSTSKTTAPEN